MSETIRSWLFGVTAAAFAAALIKLLNVRAGMKTTMRIVTGLFLLSVIVTPLGGRFSREIPRFSQLDRKEESAARAQAQAAMQSILQTTLQRQIAQIAQEAGAEVLRTDVVAEFDGSGCINIQSITVYAACDDPEKRRQFSALLQSSLGGPATIQWDEMNEALE